MKCELILDRIPYHPGDMFLGYCETHYDPDWEGDKYVDYPSWVGSLEDLRGMFEEHEEEYN